MENSQEVDLSTAPETLLISGLTSRKIFRINSGDPKFFQGRIGEF